MRRNTSKGRFLPDKGLQFQEEVEIKRGTDFRYQVISNIVALQTQAESAGENEVW